MGRAPAQPQRHSGARPGYGGPSGPFAAPVHPEPRAPRPEPRLLVVGFGNTLAADDGVGPAVVAALREAGLPDGVRAEDGGSDALRLPSLWRGEPEVWIVDAVMSGGPPGTVHRLSHDEVGSVPQRHATAHALSLPESLRWIALSYQGMAGIRYRFWGVEAERVGLVQELSRPVSEAVGPLAIELRTAAERSVRRGM